MVAEKGRESVRGAAGLEGLVRGGERGEPQTERAVEREGLRVRGIGAWSRGRCAGGDWGLKINKLLNSWNLTGTRLR